MMQTSRFTTPYYGNSLSSPLLYPTNDSRHIVEAALRISTHLYRQGYAYAKAGVGLLDLVENTFQQDDFFTANQTLASQDMMTTLDKINQRYGQGVMFLGRQGIQRQWHMCREMKSPAYTTRISDVPIVKL
jgi:DNA polymerase V